MESTRVPDGSSMVIARTDWNRYLREFHDQRPGITEGASHHAKHPQVGTPHQWLTDPLPSELDSVVDVASGNAAVLPWWSGHDSYLWIDLSQGDVELARALGRGTVSYGDARRLPLPGASVDTVVSSTGLMLVRPLERAVTEIARVLLSAGKLELLPATWPIVARDVPLGLALTVSLRSPGSMPQQVKVRRLIRLQSAVGISVDSASRRRFPLPLRTPEHASLVVRSLYTPGRSAHRLARAEALLARRAATSTELPVPLSTVVATRTHHPVGGGAL